MTARAPALLAAVLCLGGVLGACGSEPAEPVARLSVSPAEVELPYPQSAALSAAWEMTAPLDGGGSAGRPWVFIHLLDGSGAVARTFDHELPFPWRPEETRSAPVELWQSALAPPLPAGEYRLTLGLYDPATGDRWALETGAPEVARGEYEVARVRVPPPGPVPELDFAGGWWAPQEGGDRQVLARRWLQREGTLGIAGLAEPVALVLGLYVPAAGEGTRQVLAEGAEEARVRVSSPCAPEEAVVEAPGYHRVELPLEPPPDGRCTVRLEATFVLVDLEAMASRSVSLERLSWTPAARD